MNRISLPSFLVPIILLFLSMAFITDKVDIEKKKSKARQIADSLIYVHIDKKLFDKFYSFSLIDSDLGFAKQRNKSWTEKSDELPNHYALYYKLKESPIATQLIIDLDSNFKQESISGLIDNEYLKPFITGSGLKKLKQQYNFTSQFEFIFYDSIPKKVTVKPYIELRKYVRTIEKPNDPYPCIYNIDTCLALDPYNGKIIRTYTDARAECL